MKKTEELCQDLASVVVRTPARRSVTLLADPGMSGDLHTVHLTVVGTGGWRVEIAMTPGEALTLGQLLCDYPLSLISDPPRPGVTDLR